jgi:hypothetical protein
MVYNTTQHPLTPPPPHSHTLSVYTVLYDLRSPYSMKGGKRMGEVREKVQGKLFTRGVENTNMTDCISSL